METKECHITISPDLRSMRIGFEENPQGVAAIVGNVLYKYMGNLSTRIMQFESVQKIDTDHLKAGETLRVYTGSNSLRLKIISIVLETENQLQIN